MSLSPLQTALTLGFSLLAFSSSPPSSSSSASQPAQQDKADPDVDPLRPATAAQARQMIRDEDEEERMDAVGENLTVPEGGPRPALIVVMGPASCGKSTVGVNISTRLSLPFIDGDSLHPASNVAKMSAGVPLTDADRLPWLALIRSTAERACREAYQAVAAEGGPDAGEDPSADWRGSLGRPAVVIACSALKRSYRDILRGDASVDPPHPSDLPPPPSEATQDRAAHKPATDKLETYFVYCKGSRELLWSRISARKGHFMKATMLDSQLATLEDPTEEPGVCVVDIGQDATAEAEQGTQGVLKMCRR